MTARSGFLSSMFQKQDALSLAACHSMLVYKVPQAGWDPEHSSEICFSIKVDQEINRRPTKNVILKWEEEPSFFSVLWEPFRMTFPPVVGLTPGY